MRGVVMLFMPCVIALHRSLPPFLIFCLWVPKVCLENSTYRIENYVFILHGAAKWHEGLLENCPRKKQYLTIRDTQVHRDGYSVNIRLCGWHKGNHVMQVCRIFDLSGAIH